MLLLSHFPSVFTPTDTGLFPVVEAFQAIEKWRGLMRSRFGVSAEGDIVDFVWSSLLRGYDGSQTNFSAWVYKLVNVYRPNVVVELDTDNHEVTPVESQTDTVDGETLNLWLLDWFDDALYLDLSRVSVSVDTLARLVSSVSLLQGILSDVLHSVNLERSFKTLHRLFGSEASVVFGVFASSPSFWLRQVILQSRPLVRRGASVPLSRYRTRWLDGESLPSSQEVFTVDLTPAFDVYSEISLDPQPFTDDGVSPLCFKVGVSSFVRTPFGVLVSLDDFPRFDPDGDANVFVSAFIALLCRVFSAGVLERDGLSVTFSRVNRYQTTYLPVVYGGSTFPFIGRPCRSG